MQRKKYIIIFSVFIAPLIYVLSCNRSSNPNITNDVVFKSQLSSYHLFKGAMQQLHPAADVEILTLSSTLFTDYAEKQRLIRLPAGKKIILKGSGLPEFPEGTLIAKTFYYPFDQGSKYQIIETRLLLLVNAKWNAATYQWNTDQTEAFLIEDGATVQVKDKTLQGKVRKIDYRIPNHQACVSCHHSENAILPIGPKVRNLNRTVFRDGKQVNQLQYLMNKGLIQSSAIDSLQKLPSDIDRSLPIELRGRSYLDINCAHCHQPGGYAGQTTLDLNYNTPLDRSGIKLNKNNILIRMAQMGEYHMPKLGTTVVDQDGLELIKAYIKSIK